MAGATTIATQTALTFDADAVITFSVAGAAAPPSSAPASPGPTSPPTGLTPPPTPLRAPTPTPTPLRAATPAPAVERPLFQTPSRRTAGGASAAGGMPTVSPITPAFGVDSATTRGGSPRKGRVAFKKNLSRARWMVAA